MPSRGAAQGRGRVFADPASVAGPTHRRAHSVVVASAERKMTEESANASPPGTARPMIPRAPGARRVESPLGAPLPPIFVVLSGRAASARPLRLLARPRARLPLLARASLSSPDGRGPSRPGRRRLRGRWPRGRACAATSLGLSWKASAGSVGRRRPSGPTGASSRGGRGNDSSLSSRGRTGIVRLVGPRPRPHLFPSWAAMMAALYPSTDLGRLLLPPCLLPHPPLRRQTR